MNFLKSMHSFFSHLTRVQKVFLALLAFVLCVEVFFLAKKIASPKAKTIFVFQNQNYGELIPCNANARKKTLARGASYFRFSKKQLQTISDYLSQNESASLSLFIRSLSETNDSSRFEYSFLFEAEFAENKKVNEKLSLRPSIKINASGEPAFFLSLALEKNTNKIPLGFALSFVNENEADAFSLERITLEKTFVGYDKTKAISHFGFAPNGSDIFSTNDTAFDFSGASLVFPTQNTNAHFMPNFVISFLPLSSYDEKIINHVFIGGQKINLHRTKAITEANDEMQIDTYVLQTSALSNPFAKANFSNDENSVRAFFMSDNFSNANVSDEQSSTNENSLDENFIEEHLKPLPCDVGEIVSWKKEKWRRSDFEIFRWNKFPRVLIFDTSDYEMQNQLFRRLSFFVEKAGYKGTLQSDEVLKDKHAYNAHDYKADDLARFFTKAQSEHFPLNEKEIALCNILLAEKIIVKTENGFEALEDGAVLSISQESNTWLRSRLLTHECLHGIFFTNEAFRSMVAAVFYLTNEKARDFLKGYWTSQATLSYDTNDDYLVQNEFMAYLLQQRVSEVGAYFVNLAKWNSVQHAIPALANYVIETNASDFTEAARLLSDYVFEKWGFEAGRVSLVD